MDHYNNYLVRENTSDNVPSSASRPKSNSSNSQNFDMNSLSLGLPSPPISNRSGVEYGVSASFRNAGLSSPMDVDGASSIPNPVADQHFPGKNESGISLQRAIEAEYTSTPAVGKLVENGHNEAGYDFHRVNTSVQDISIGTQTNINAPNARTLYALACLTQDCAINSTRHFNSSPSENLTPHDDGAKTPCDEGTNSTMASHSHQAEYDASKYMSSNASSTWSHLDTGLASVMNNNVGHVMKDVQPLSSKIIRDYASKNNSSFSSASSQAFSSDNLDCSLSSHPANGSNSCSSAVPSSPSSASSSSSGPSLVLLKSESSEDEKAGLTLPKFSQNASPQDKFRRNPLNDTEKALALHSKELTANTASDDQADCSICLSDLNEESPYKSDEDVARDLVGCVQLRGCGHGFHTACLLKTLAVDSSSICCPFCKTIHGIMTGTQPKDGHMTVRANSYSLPGYEGTRTIVITYSFSRGIQGPEHPTPGRPYYLMGFPRTAYLPDIPQGRKVLRLLREAFNRRLTFTVGTSATLNQSDCVIWNGIHHKTETTNHGGHGYPDPKYLDNVTMELAAVGVTEDNCTATSELDDDYDDLAQAHGASSTASKYGSLHGSSNYNVASGSSKYYGASGSSNYNVASGSSKYNMASGSSKYNVASGSSKYNGTSGSSKYNGTSGSSNYNWTSGSSKHNGASGSSSTSDGASGSLKHQGATGVGTSVSSGSSTSAIAEGVSSLLSVLSVKKKTSNAGDSSSYMQRNSTSGMTVSSQIKFRAKPKGGAEKLLANSSVEVLTSGSSDATCFLCNQALGTEGPAQSRSLSDRDVVGAVMLNNCGHSFHCCCLYPFLTSASECFRCPVCGSLHGVITGSQPRNGKMNCWTENRSLPGHKDCKTIVISYSICEGYQGPQHPNPGYPYSVIGFPRRAYLPDSQKGRLVKSLLKKAFDRCLIFTVGYSASKGLPDCVTWDRISHKTFTSGGGPFGYPDPKYLDTVLLELAALGVTEKS